MPNTRRAYRSAEVRFTRWCAIHGQTVLHASPERIAAFLTAEARGNLAVNTLCLGTKAVIRYVHLRRDQVRAPSQVKEKTASVLDRLRSALLTIPAPRITRPGVAARRLRGGTAPEREIAGLNVPNCAPPGWRRAISALAQDRSGLALRNRLPFRRTDLCPAKALDA